MITGFNERFGFLTPGVYALGFAQAGSSDESKPALPEPVSDSQPQADPPMEPSPEASSQPSLDEKKRWYCGCSIAVDLYGDVWLTVGQEVYRQDHQLVEASWGRC